jgi:hypothetical protein
LQFSLHCRLIVIGVADKEMGNHPLLSASRGTNKAVEITDKLLRQVWLSLPEARIGVGFACIAYPRMIAVAGSDAATSISHNGKRPMQ